MSKEKQELKKVTGSISEAAENDLMFLKGLYGAKNYGQVFEKLIKEAASKEMHAIALERVQSGDV